MVNYGPGVERQAIVRARARRPGDPLRRPLKVFTIDPEVSKVDGATATVDVPWEPLHPGPSGLLFVVDPDADARVDLEDPRILIQGGLDPAVSDPLFRQQMVYAVAARVYAQFQSALGRRIAWGFALNDGRLHLLTDVESLGENAAYEHDDGRLSFGSFRKSGAGAGRCPPDATVYACLSHDAIAHEMTHALLSGLRSHFDVPTNGDVPGFHEGFADLIAVFQHFTHREVLTSQIKRTRGDLTRASLLTNIAGQLGLTTRGGPLRCAIDEKATYRADMEAHEMGSVLVSAVFTAFSRVYARKTERYVRLGMRADEPYMRPELVDILSTEARDLAAQFLSLCIRAIDYCPPVDLRLGEYLRALITADRELVPEDPWGYREALMDAFAERGIYPDSVGQLEERSLVWSAPSRTFEPIAGLSFSSLHFAGDPSLPAGPEELKRQAQVLGDFITRPRYAAEFGLEPEGSGVSPCTIESVRMARRVGPDGQVLFDLVAEVTQKRMAVDPETGVDAKFFGGCTLIIGPDGDIRYSIVKHVGSTNRLARQLQYQRESPTTWEKKAGQYRMTGYANRIAHKGRTV